MERLGLDHPRTEEEFSELLRAFVDDDPDGDGAYDTAGVALTHRMIDLVFAAYGIKYGSVAMPYNLLNGTVVLAHEMPGFWDAVAYMRGLYEAGLVDPGLVRTGYDRQAVELAQSGRLGVFARNINWGPRLNGPTRALDPDASWTIAPLFESNGYGRHPYLETFEASLTGIIAESADHPEAVLRYVNMQADPENRLLMTHGVEGVHCRVVDGVPVEIDPERNAREQYYARHSSYFILRGPNIDSPETALDWARQAADPLQREGYRLQARALSLLDEPYEYPRYDLPVYMPRTSSYHESLRADLESVVVKAIVGGSRFTLDDARVALEIALERNHYAEVKWELNEFSSTTLDQ
jgi:putative aldouronate transport system substrate-binding protein